MKTIAAIAAFACPVWTFQSPLSQKASGRLSMGTQDDLKALAMAQNPTIGYFDPLGLAEKTFWPDAMEGASDEEINAATVAFLRHAEMKHGRVAMAGFVGYCVHANGITFPGAMNLKGETFAEIAARGEGNPAAIWDVLPEGAKWQFLIAIFLFEMVGEITVLHEANGGNHYMRGGKPGSYPPFSVPTENGKKDGYPLNLFDPFGFTSNLTEEQKARKLNIEINNGRLAMIGLFAFLVESKIPGAVPALKNIVVPYTGDYMAPFEADFHVF